MASALSSPKVKVRILIYDLYGVKLYVGASFQTIVQYVDTQFEKYLKDESGLNRRNIVDTRVHCCFYFISSATHGYHCRHYLLQVI